MEPISNEEFKRNREKAIQYIQRLYEEGVWAYRLFGNLILEVKTETTCKK